jgi:general stress protein 26
MWYEFQRSIVEERIPMSRARDERDAAEVDRLLAGAAKSIATIRYCWLATAAETGDANLRPMGWLHAGENDWTIQFVTDGRSRKVAEIRRASKVAIVFQREADDTYITLIGTATLRERVSEVRQRWKGAYDAYFPTESDRANAVFVEVEVERMELWVRGLTPEPFGLHATVLQRDSGGWRVMS